MYKVYLFALIIAFSSALPAQEVALGKDGKYYQGDRLFTGVYSEKDTSGVLLSEKSIRDGQEDGLSTFYYADGSKKEQRSYRQGKKDGSWMNWNGHGIKTAEASYKNDKKDGYWYVWDDNGNKRYEMFYEKGEKKGSWYMWDENGKLVMEKKY